MSINTENVFSALALSEIMAKSLPKQPSPQLRNPFDAIALLSHACMLAVGFRLLGLGEDHRLGTDTAFPNLDVWAKLTIIEEVTSETPDTQPLPRDWNASTTSDYAFRYAHSQSSLEYLVKVSRLGSKAVVNGLGMGDDKVHSIDILIKDFVSESSFPYTIPSESDNETALSLRKCFISAGRLTDTGSLLKLHIIQKLAPGLRKEGYEESAHAASHNTNQHDQDQGRGLPYPSRGEDPAHDPLRDDRLPPYAQPRPFQDPLLGQPRRPFPAGDFPPPGFEDEYEMNRPGGREGIGGRPLNIGERDLYPPGLGPHDPLRGGGLAPSGGGGGGGMHPTFDDPMFDGRLGGRAVGTGGQYVSISL